MVALRVAVNGEHLCVAGAEDLAVLNAIVNAGGNLGSLTKKNDPNEMPHVNFTVGGLTGRADGQDEHLRWAEGRPLRVGDQVEVEIM